MTCRGSRYLKVQRRAMETEPGCGAESESCFKLLPPRRCTNSWTHRREAPAKRLLFGPKRLPFPRAWNDVAAPGAASCATDLLDDRFPRGSPSRLKQHPTSVSATGLSTIRLELSTGAAHRFSSSCTTLWDRRVLNALALVQRSTLAASARMLSALDEQQRERIPQSCL